jgi:plastocyanin
MKRLSAAMLALAALLAVSSGILIVRSANAGGGGCHQPRTEGAGASVDLEENCFLPTVLHAGAGDTVSFTSHDKQLHTVTGSGSQHPDGWGNFDEMGEGAVVTHTFDESGVYPYFCMLHPGMVGAIVVEGSPEGAPSASLRPLVGATPAGTTSEGGASDRVPAAIGGGTLALLLAGAAGTWLWRRSKVAHD